MPRLEALLDPPAQARLLVAAEIEPALLLDVCEQRVESCFIVCRRLGVDHDRCSSRTSWLVSSVSSNSRTTTASCTAFSAFRARRAAVARLPRPSNRL